MPGAPHLTSGMTSVVVALCGCVFLLISMSTFAVSYTGAEWKCYNETGTSKISVETAAVGLAGTSYVVVLSFSISVGIIISLFYRPLRWKYARMVGFIISVFLMSIGVVSLFAGAIMMAIEIDDWVKIYHDVSIRDDYKKFTNPCPAPPVFVISMIFNFVGAIMLVIMIITMIAAVVLNFVNKERKNKDKGKDKEIDKEKEKEKGDSDNDNEKEDEAKSPFISAVSSPGRHKSSVGDDQVSIEMRQMAVSSEDNNLLDP